MSKMILIASLIFAASSAMAYDSSWYTSDGWSGEYPPGFQVYKRGVTVLGRTSVDDTQAPSVSCVLKRNRYAPGKAVPKATYVEVTKIVEMKAKKDFSYATSRYNEKTKQFEDYSVDIRSGELVEFLTYYAEGLFKARYMGQEFDASQDLYDNLTFPSDKDGYMPYQADNWVNLSCMNKVSVWLRLSDLQTVDADGNEQWIDGVRGYFHNPY